MIVLAVALAKMRILCDWCILWLSSRSEQDCLAVGVKRPWSRGGSPEGCEGGGKRYSIEVKIDG
jgi:hypothetical protein